MLFLGSRASETRRLPRLRAILVDQAQPFSQNRSSELSVKGERQGIATCTPDTFTDVIS
jgi:hypothetical protein